MVQWCAFWCRLTCPRPRNFRPTTYHRTVHFLCVLWPVRVGRGLRTALHEVCQRVFGKQEYGNQTSRINPPDGFVENALQVALGERRAFKVFDSLDFLGCRHALLVRDWRHTPLAQRLFGGLVITKIEFGANEDDRNAGRVVLDFGIPLRKCKRPRFLLVVSR